MTYYRGAIVNRLYNNNGVSLIELMVAVAIGCAVAFMGMDSIQQLYQFQREFADAEALTSFEMEVTRAFNRGTACIDTLTSGGSFKITNSTFSNGGTYALPKLAITPTPYSTGQVVDQRFTLKKIEISNQGPSGELSNLTAGSIVELWLRLKFSYQPNGAISPNLTRVIPVAVSVNGANPPAVEGCTSFESKDLISYVCGDLGAAPNSQYNSCDFSKGTSVLQAPICDAVTHGLVGTDGRCH